MNNVFSHVDLFPRRPFETVKDFFRAIRWGFQRVSRGYADIDVWSIDEWFLSVVPDMIAQLRRETHGHPADMTEEEWDKYLSELESCLRAGDFSEWEIPTTVKSYDEYASALGSLHRGLSMFSERFYDLWD